MGESYRDRTYGSPSRVLRFAHTTRFELALALVGERARSDSRILDFGAGDGHFLSLLRDRGVGGQLFGLDRYADPSRIQAAIDAGQVTWVREPEALAGQDLDLICTFETLEHVPAATIDAFVSLCNDRLVSGGHIVVSVPIEVGPPVVAKSVIRATMGSPRHLATPRNLARCFLGRTHRVPRATEGTQIGHIGFNHFELARTFDQRLHARRVLERYSPAPWLPWWLNSQVFWVYEQP